MIVDTNIATLHSGYIDPNVKSDDALLFALNLLLAVPLGYRPFITLCHRSTVIYPFSRRYLPHMSHVASPRIDFRSVGVDLGANYFFLITGAPSSFHRSLYSSLF